MSLAAHTCPDCRAKDQYIDSLERSLFPTPRPIYLDDDAFPPEPALTCSATAEEEAEYITYLQARAYDAAKMRERVGCPLCGVTDPRLYTSWQWACLRCKDQV